MKSGINARKFICTLTASRLLVAGTKPGNNLDQCLKRYLGVEPGKDHSLSNWGAMLLTADQLTYAARDVAYHLLNIAKIVRILRRISESMHSAQQEPISFHGPLTVEHILPQSWVANWPLADGSSGLNSWELYTAISDDPRLESTRRRNAALQTIENLTLLTQSLNSSVSNAAWVSKKEAILDATLLPITQRLRRYDSWNEDAITQRGKELLNEARKIWPGPA